MSDRLFKWVPLDWAAPAEFDPQEWSFWIGGLFGKEGEDMKHDELVMWIYKNAEAVIKYLDIPSRLKMPGKEWKIVGRHWEVPVSERFGRNHKKDIGFIDLVILVDVLYEESCPEYLWSKSTDEWRYDDGGWSVPKSAERRTSVYKRSAPAAVIVEAKPRIDDLGALIRQLRTYHVEERGLNVKCVVCPDDTHAELLREQGFLFYRAPRDLNNLELGL